jgi:hypothetical protein
MSWVFLVDVGINTDVRYWRKVDITRLSPTPAFVGKADITRMHCNVRFRPKAYIGNAKIAVVQWLPVSVLVSSCCQHQDGGPLVPLRPLLSK